MHHAWLVVNKGIGAWPPSALDGMALDELYRWYDIAVAQLEAEAEASNPQGK